MGEEKRVEHHSPALKLVDAFIRGGTMNKSRQEAAPKDMRSANVIVRVCQLQKKINFIHMPMRDFVHF
jgi:hypothetical protein